MAKEKQEYRDEELMEGLEALNKEGNLAELPVARRRHLEKLQKQGMGGEGSADAPATVESTQFTETFGSDKKKKREDEVVKVFENPDAVVEQHVDKVPTCDDPDEDGCNCAVGVSVTGANKEEDLSKRTCLAGWGDCRDCNIEKCEDREKHEALHHLDLIKADDKSVFIAGYASPHVVDDEGHRIELPALKNAMQKFMVVKQFRNVMVAHTGIQVGYVVPSVEDSKGKIIETRVDDKGLFVVCKLRSDILPGKEVIDAVNKGELNSFSIRGRGLERKFECAGGECFWSIVKLELYEITVCKRGVNPDAKFMLVKDRDKVTHISDEEGAMMQKGESVTTIEVESDDADQIIDSVLQGIKKLLKLYMKG